MLKKKYNIRKIIMVFMFIIPFTIYGGRLINMQVANAESYRNKIERTTVRYYTVPAFRGEIFDRNGEPLVTNRPVYNLTILGKYLNRKTMYDTITALIKLVEDNGCIIKEDSLPVNEIRNPDGSYEYIYSTALAVNANIRNSFNKYLNDRKLDLEITADQLMEYIVQTFALDDCPPENLRQIAGIFYDFDRHDVLGGSADHVLSGDVNTFIMTYVKEHSLDFPGVEIIPSYERVFNHPGVASHILGRTGKITNYTAYYEENDYPLNAVVGVGGVEMALEQYLRGKDGTIKKTYDEQGNLIKEEYKDMYGKDAEPIEGKNVYLTIDYKLQAFSEKCIPLNIAKIHALAAKDKNPAIAGIDASAGSVVVMKPNNGEILAIATYPTFDNANFDFTSLYLDPASPLLNRAASGQYPPGSTFKLSTSLAGLCEGIITPNSEIEDKGIWTKYGTGYQPRCWKYLYRTGANHGHLNVVTAIKESCNYFFFELGDRLGIEKMNEYSRALGYGEYTGIEVGETKGTLASIGYADANNIKWDQGQVIQSAIGQSYNTFSPLQMATALSTILNGGTRYSSHILKSVNEFHTNNVVFYKETEILSQIEINDVIKQTLKQGMNEVMEATGGTASTLFNNFPIRIGGKTGTAQIKYGSSDLATFVSFAPFDEPEIVISVVIEYGAKGTYAGFIAKDIMEYYFGFRTAEEILGVESDNIT